MINFNRPILGLASSGAVEGADVRGGTGVGSTQGGRAPLFMFQAIAPARGAGIAGLGGHDRDPTGRSAEKGRCSAANCRVTRKNVNLGGQQNVPSLGPSRMTGLPRFGKLPVLGAPGQESSALTRRCLWRLPQPARQLEHSYRHGGREPPSLAAVFRKARSSQPGFHPGRRVESTERPGASRHFFDGHR